MNNQFKKEQFVQLRAEGLSFQKISEKLEISKPTLIKWNKELENAIASEQYTRIELLLEDYQLLRSSRIAFYSQILNDLFCELKKRDLTNLSTKDLFSLVLSIEKKLKEEVSPFAFPMEEFKPDWMTQSLDIKEKTLKIPF
jgi:hypothetical protein